MEFNRVINCDCDVVMAELLKEGVHFDLICTDPPYNLNKDFGNDSDKLELKDFLAITEKRVGVCRDLLTSEGSLVWFGIHHYIGFIQAIMYNAGLFYRRMNIWYYENGFSRSNKAPQTQYEPFLWFSKSKSKWTFNADDVRVPYKSTERLKNPVYYKDKNGERKAWIPNPKGAMRGDVWCYPTLAGKKFEKEKTPHPTQKPEALIMELIKAFCPKDAEGHYCGTILDPFHGSGTLGVCCEKLNREGHKIKWLGIELEKRWCDIAEERIRTVCQS